MSLVAFQQFLQHRSPSFQCRSAGDRNESLGFTASIKHDLRGPASTTSLKKIDSQLGPQGSSLRKLFALYDGMVLFCDTKSDAAGIEFFPVEEWQEQTAEMRKSMEEMGIESNDMPDWFNSGIAIGHIPHSGNFLVVATQGTDAGKVYYADHDDFSDQPLAADVESLIGLLIDDPAQFFYDRGCYLRYSDGKTKKQWIPKQYLNLGGDSEVDAS